MTTGELLSHFQGSVRNGAAFFILNILCQIELQPKFRLRDVIFSFAMTEVILYF
jgi:hypothetical protein